MSIGQELSSLDFESMIGGPLSAVIKAQAQSAITSVDFIKSVGFTDDKPTMVSFQYKKPVEVTTTTGDTTTTDVELRDYSLDVPLLAMLPIPFIRVEETTIDFNAKITSVQKRSLTSEHGLGVEFGTKLDLGKFSASLKVNYSYKRSTTSSSKVERTYSLAVHVRAVQDELPAGTERLLNILENTIVETPSNTTT